MVKITLLNNDGGGFAEVHEIEEDTSILNFCTNRAEEQDEEFISEDWVIRVNRTPVVKNYVLQNNDRITITPSKISGA